MVVEWSGNACIICLKHAELSLEHIIPDSLRGRLTSKFLCQQCNSFFGQHIDAHAKSDPAIRSAAYALQESIPSHVASIEEGQRYRIHTEVVTLVGKRQGNNFLAKWHDMPDGSVIAPQRQAVVSLRGMMRADGVSTVRIDEAIANYEAAEPGEVVTLLGGLKAKKLSAYLVGPDLRAPSVDVLLFVKIAYEFVALLVGTAIYSRNDQLDEIRDVLKKLRRDSNAFRVEILEAERASPFHGIAFEGNSPHAIIQVRLFGKQAFRVHLNHLAVQHAPFSYTHDLESNEHFARFLDEPK